MNRRTIVLRLMDLQRGLLEGDLGRAALLLELEKLYSALGGPENGLRGALPKGTQLAIAGEQGGQEAAQRRNTAAKVLRERAEHMVRYWIVRTGRDAKRTEVSRDRVQLVAKMLKTKTDEEAMQAIANVADDDWRQGDNDRGKRFDAIEHIFGKGVERFEELRDSGEADIAVDVALDETVGKKQRPKRSRAEIQAALKIANDHRMRASKGGDRDGFNRWSREERRLRREMGEGP